MPNSNRVTGRVFLSALATVFLASSALAAEFANEGSIDLVTVYPDRASVTRSVRIDYSSGAHTLTVAGLPAGADENAVRVSAGGSSLITIHNVQTARIELAESPDPNVARLKKSITNTMDELKRIELDIAARNMQIEFLENLAKARAESAGRDLTATVPTSKPTARELGELLDFLYERRVEARSAIVGAERERDRIARELDRLRRELAGVQGKARRRTKTVSVDFTAERGGSGTFTIEYIVPGAGWAPVYMIRGDAAKSKVHVSYLAHVWQRTGEDWPDVKLRLSTAVPRIGAKAPKLRPWIVDFHRPRPPRAARALKKAKLRQGAVSAPMEGRVALDEKAAAPVPAAAAVAAVRPTGTAVTFEVARPDTVHSGGARTKVTIAELSFRAKNTYVTTPKLSPHVYLRATFDNKSAYPFLPGPSFVFLGDNFVGKGAVKATAPGQEVKIDLGVDSGFKIERKLVKKETSREGMISKKTVTRYVFETTLESYKKKQRTVEVRDHLPLSRDEAIVVRNVVLSPKPAERDERNILTWSLPVKPKEKKTIRMEFTIEYPRDRRPFGLE